MINFTELQKIDSHKMYSVYDKWPELAYNSFNSALEKIGFLEIDHIVFAGMGGSGNLGSIFESILSKTNVHVSLVKGYVLPKTVNSNTLVVTTSISGNTIETLTILDSAKKLNCKIIGLSSGGKMKEYCLKHDVEYREIPQYHSPRASFTSFLYSMLKILDPILPIPVNDIKESIKDLEILKNNISSDNLSDDNKAINLANWISIIPIIYYPFGLQSSAIRFKNSLQENAKMHAMSEDVLEACHNGIMAWEKSSKCAPILIQGEDDYVKTKERWKIVKEYFQKNSIEYYDIHSGHGSILTKLIHLIYLLDYATIYLAIKLGRDPSPIDSIDFVKKRL